MINFLIEETGKIESLKLIDSKSGVDFINEYIGQTGAFAKGSEFSHYDFKTDAYKCSQSVYEWWKKRINEQQQLIFRIHKLEGEFGMCEVERVINNVEVIDVESEAHLINLALDKAFGKEIMNRTRELIVQAGKDLCEGNAILTHDWVDMNKCTLRDAEEVGDAIATLIELYYEFGFKFAPAGKS